MPNRRRPAAGRQVHPAAPFQRPSFCPSAGHLPSAGCAAPPTADLAAFHVKRRPATTRSVHRSTCGRSSAATAHPPPAATATTDVRVQPAGPTSCECASAGGTQSLFRGRFPKSAPVLHSADASRPPPGVRRVPGHQPTPRPGTRCRHHRLGRVSGPSTRPDAIRPAPSYPGSTARPPHARVAADLTRGRAQAIIADTEGHQPPGCPVRPKPLTIGAPSGRSPRSCGREGSGAAGEAGRQRGRSGTISRSPGTRRSKARQTAGTASKVAPCAGPGPNCTRLMPGRCFMTRPSTEGRVAWSARHKNIAATEAETGLERVRARAGDRRTVPGGVDAGSPGERESRGGDRGP